ncbi:hypothetical protein G7Y79_00009g027400 [Physcia stellaris]|nr:hypothetical protein G7Y79_00009g027400 [Physcia stellaris]
MLHRGLKIDPLQFLWLLLVNISVIIRERESDQERDYDDPTSTYRRTPGGYTTAERYRVPAEEQKVDHLAMPEKSTRDLEDESDHDEMGYQYMHLEDISVVTEASTSRESLTKSDPGHDRSSTLPDDKQQWAEYKEGNSLAISFGRISALTDSIILHFDTKTKDELVDLHLPLDILTEFVQYLEGRVLLDLRIWAKDLTFNDEFAFDHLDSIQWSFGEAAELMINEGILHGGVGTKVDSDGGGVRNYSSLLILKALMERVRSKTELSQLRPAEVFDFIVGSSSGGLIAIMLGRLGMTVDETISKYIEFTEAVFRRSRWFSVRGLVWPSFEGWRRNIFSAPSAPSKTGVIAWDSKSKCPYMFRTYDCFGNKEQISQPLNPGPADSHQIWQIARATTASPPYFSPMKLGDRVFLDGGISTNNPTQEAVRDLRSLYNGILNDACIVSVGSGLASKHRSPKHPSKIPWIRSIEAILAFTRQIVTQTESIHLAVRDFLEDSHASYFRFDVEDVGDIRINDWRLLEHISKRTRQHLSTDAARDTLDRCAKALIHNFRSQSLGNEQSFNDSNVAKQQKKSRSGPDSSPSTTLINEESVEDPT